MNVADKIERFIRLADDLEQIRDCGVNEKTIYDIVFSDYFYRELGETGIPFEWRDPDTGYGDSVWAYVEALVEKAEELSKIKSALETGEEGE